MVGRGAQFNPPNRFTRIAYEDEHEYVDDDPGELAARQNLRTEYFTDHAKSIIAENNSPDVPFRFSLNPYRGCAHGCSYCFARPTHEYFDLSAGLDFETKIFVKEHAADLLRDWFNRVGYVPEVIAMSGVTDCYQPIEKQLRITRQCLEVFLEARHPVAVVTKNALVTRDLDLLKEMACHRIAHVTISVTTLNQSLAKIMEPRTSSPAARLRAIEELRQAGVPVGVLVAPIIPGLTDHETPAILKAVHDAGAVSAGYVLLRLPYAVEPIFRDWLARLQPEKKAKVEARIRATRAGQMYQSEFGTRMRGHGAIADQIHQTFNVFLRRFGMDQPMPSLDTTNFRKPRPSSGQQWLFS